MEDRLLAARKYSILEVMSISIVIVNYKLKYKTMFRFRHSEYSKLNKTFFCIDNAVHKITLSTKSFYILNCLDSGQEKYSRHWIFVSDLRECPSF